MQVRLAFAPLLFLTLTAHAAEPADTSCRALLAAATNANGFVDWTAFRLAYADSPNFDLFGKATAATRKAMMNAMQAGDFDRAAEQALLLLDRECVDIDAHIVADVAFQKLGNGTKAKEHERAVVGLVDSVRTSDGRTPPTAFTVITVREEYGMLHALGLQPKGQSLIRADGHAYDRLDAVDRDGKPQSLYFLIDRVLAAEGAALKAKK